MSGGSVATRPGRIDRRAPYDLGVRRFVQEELLWAARRVEVGDDAGVHEARRSLKRVGSLLRALRAGALRRRVREVARGLGPVRGPASLAEALAELLEEQPELGPSLAATAARLGDREVWRGGPQVARRLRALAVRAPSSLPSGTDRAALARGIRRALKRARRAFRDLDAPDDAALHAWRCRVKDLAHLGRALPGPPFLPRGVAERVGTILGRHRDLGLLSDALDAEARDAVGPRLAAAREALLARAVALGAELHAGEPRRVAEAWRRAGRGHHRP